jgi:hypothetical protein
MSSEDAFPEGSDHPERTPLRAYQRPNATGGSHGNLFPIVSALVDVRRQGSHDVLRFTDPHVGWLCSRSAAINRIFEGRPAILIRQGQRDTHAMKRENVPGAALDRALHQAGREDEEGISIGRLEPNGRITLIPNTAKPMAGD